MTIQVSRNVMEVQEMFEYECLTNETTAVNENACSPFLGACYPEVD